MPVKTIRLKSIEAKRYIEPNQAPRPLRIDHNVTVMNITLSGENNSNVEFQYVANYGTVGIIRMEGDLIFEDNNVKDMVEMWKSSRKMPDNIATAVHNAIIHACLTEAVFIARDLNLPPPIPLPQIKIGKTPKREGPEIA
ncbi:MAG: hypothetical protein DRN18_03215 [Thermoplasmata archaeon]|nr:MAG: hypothetical protein DRN18_03215 [Thermoplasmata archaeon]